MKLSKYKITITGFLISLILYIVVHFLDVDLFEIFVEIIMKFETFELDELIFPLLVLLISGSINIFIASRDKDAKLQKYRLFKAMLNSLHHIINNFLNQAQIVKIEAEKSRDFNKDILILYEEIIDEASELTKSLESADYLDEESIADSVKPK